jgi:Rho-binding antiterminator
MTEYTPIDCQLYSEYELAILRRRLLRIFWQDKNGLTHMDVVMPLDLQTCGGAEYLFARGRAGDTLPIAARAHCPHAAL